MRIIKLIKCVTELKAISSYVKRENCELNLATAANNLLSNIVVIKDTFSQIVRKDPQDFTYLTNELKSSETYICISVHADMNTNKILKLVFVKYDNNINSFFMLKNHLRVGKKIYFLH